ncbi:hypothetical protein ACHAWF_005432 [Thalassiosira exigua]
MFPRRQTKSSYIRKEMTQSGDLSTSRDRSRRSGATANPARARPAAIVAVEPDSDESNRGRRIDQGLIDASREAQNQVLALPQAAAAAADPPKGSSWWTTGFSSQHPTGLPPAHPPPGPVGLSHPQPRTAPPDKSILGVSAPTIRAGSHPATMKHRRTVSYNKTFRVP